MLKKLLNRVIDFFSINKKKSSIRFFKNILRNRSRSYEELIGKVKRLEHIIEEKSKLTEDLKTAFLKNIYHEIRTPMNSIVGFTNLLAQRDLTEDQKSRFAENIKKSSQDFLKLIDDLIEASLLDTGEISIKKGECDLIMMMDELYSCFSLQNRIIGKSNIALLQNPDSQFKKLIVYSDGKILFDVLSNLLSNAFKFTEKGIIEYGYKVLNDYKLLFFVKDSGIGGLDKGDNSIYKSFTKTEHCYDSTNKGFGLGLKIAKNKIELLGGEIWVESNEFKGTSFKFIVPLEKVDGTGKIEDNIKNIKKNVFQRLMHDRFDFQN